MGATIFGKIYHKQCCCALGCNGCCVPVTGDTLDAIPFEVDAPTCASIDGVTGEFTDEAIEPEQHACGPCASYAWIDGPLTVASVSYNPDGMGGCDEIPGLGLDINLKLKCSGPLGVSDNTSLPGCCRGLRLYCGTSYETVCADPDIVDPSHGNYITVISPTSCTCDPLSVIFSLACLVPKPQTNPSPECPFAPGFEVPDCDLADVDIVI